MKYALGRAGKWFFGTIIVSGFILGFAIGDANKKQQPFTTFDFEWWSAATLGIALVVAGWIFSATLATIEELKLERQLKQEKEEDEA